MNMMKSIAAAMTAAATLAVANPNMGLAAEQSLILDVKMTCPQSQPPIVVESLKQVPGVLSVYVSFKAQNAEVRFDDGETTPAMIRAALAGVDFPNTDGMGMDDSMDDM